MFSSVRLGATTLSFEWVFSSYLARVYQSTNRWHKTAADSGNNKSMTLNQVATHPGNNIINTLTSVY
jgi:hypothetical protein